MLTIDGAYGEGGGQIIRTALALAAILTQPVRLINIRANRSTPGLAAQHLTAVNAAAMVCEARVTGDRLKSTTLVFEPQVAPVAGFYEFDVAQAREGGSAGAATLVLQTVLLPLMFAPGTSEVTVKGGTHVPWSPPFHYISEVYLPSLARLNLTATAELVAWGWYPAGGGEIKLQVVGAASPVARQPLPVWHERGSLKQVGGVAVASSLPAHIAQRICNRALNLLEQAGLPAMIEPQRVRSVSPGAGLFLTAEYGNGGPSWAGFSALGKQGKPSEQVAQEAVDDLLAFQHSEAVIDEHLADQLILPLAVLGQAIRLKVQRISQHTLTNLAVVEQFLGPVATVDQHHRVIEFAQRNTS